MKLWFRKISVVLITIMTLGLYIPPTYLDADAEKSKEAVSSNDTIKQDEITSITEISEENELDVTLEDDDFISVLTEQAKEQTISKLGPKISNQIEADFETTILPNLEIVLQDILANAGEEASAYLAITEGPTQGFGERIFNIYDNRTKKDIAKFHVRRDNRPQEGYWFNFHYHVSSDGFENHHEIGEVYWDKNVPPKWMT
ncbi:YpjP family protein [Virgibacillus sp. DJP39]|uniref:YpjP family protein n=1 Tax=Virgibacillus sp. DJP39 TaxID=3409790 RepID=UPI003BB77E14